MIDPTIWEDEDFGKLTADAKLLFIGLFSNADDEGRIRANPSYIKSTIFMYDNKTLKNIDDLVWLVSGLMKSVKLYTIDGKQYIQLLHWDEYQKQHKDRVVPSTLPPYVEDVSDNVGQVTDNVGQVPTQDKLSKVKLSKERREEVTSPQKSISYLKEIPPEDLAEFTSKYQITEAQLRKKAVELVNYCQMHGKTYKDYKAFLRNSISKDFTERPIPSSEKSIAEIIQERQKGNYGVDI